MSNQQIKNIKHHIKWCEDQEEKIKIKRLLWEKDLDELEKNTPICEDDDMGTFSILHDQPYFTIDNNVAFKDVKNILEYWNKTLPPDMVIWYYFCIHDIEIDLKKNMLNNKINNGYAKYDR